MALVYLACVAALAGGVWRLGHRAALDQIARGGQADLALAADRLTGELQRYRELAVLMADHPTLRPLLEPQEGGGAAGGSPAGEAAAGGAAGPLPGLGAPAPRPVQAAASLLVRTADRTGSLDILLIDAEGREVLSAVEVAPGFGSAAAPPPAFVPHAGGRSHAEESHFRRAMDGALGVGHRFSDRYGRRAFSFAAPVFGRGGGVVGAVVVVTDVEDVEAAWRGGRPAVFFTDADGVVFVSNRSELVFRARHGTPAPEAKTVTGGLAPFVSHVETWLGPHRLWQVDAGRYIPERALHLTLPLPVIGMTGEALLDIGPARAAASLQAAAVAAVCLAFGALLFVATERRRALASANARLEAQVARRTAALSALNADLRREVEERSAAETRLQRAQAELVQAAKLSALGQMSAGISHELNQPLMAIRSFAENAEAFLDRGRPEAAAQNLGRISELARRMGRIIRNLRAFARQESEALTDVDLRTVVEAVLEMVAGRARLGGVTVTWTPPEAPPGAPILVRGGEVRLQQVILNLVTNAIDAMEDSPVRHVEIGAAATGGRVRLWVRDSGPGIAEPDRIFDPFYTTKGVGAASLGAAGAGEGGQEPAQGMGLGLSISYGLVQSFGGMIRGRNLPQGGAEFTVELDAAQAARAA